MKRLKTKIVKPKKDLLYLDKIGRRLVESKTKYFRRDLHLNHKSLGIKIIKIKNKQSFFEETKGLKEMDPNKCFFLYHIYYDDLSDWLLVSKDRDAIITDASTNKIIGFNNNVKQYPDFVNIWIVKQKIPELNNMKIDDILFTR